jgi:hypothetical protein
MVQAWQRCWHSGARGDDAGAAAAVAMALVRPHPKCDRVGLEVEVEVVKL